MEQNHFPQLLNLGKHVKYFEHGDFVQFCEDWTKQKIFSKIKPPLLVVIQTKVLWRKSFLFGLPTNLQVAFDSSHQLTDYKNLEVVEFSQLQLPQTAEVLHGEHQLNNFFVNRCFMY